MKKKTNHTINPNNTNMKNRWSRLDFSFVKDLTATEIDDIFITSLLWGEEEDNDYITAHNMTLYFLQYPGLDTREKVYDKTWVCIGKMMDRKLLKCGTLRDSDISFGELNKYRDMVYRVMDDECTGEEMYKFIFAITDKGQEFLQTHLPQYQPILKEIGRLFHEDIQHGEKKRKSHN